MLDRFDAVVIGGGPAGALSAMHLAKLGWHTALIERGERFRDKACGHCLNVRALKALGRAGLLESVRAIGQGETRCLRVHRGQNRSSTFEFSNGDLGRADGGLIVPRHALDQLLMDRAAATGVMVMQPASAVKFDFEQSRNAVHVIAGNSRLTLRCGLLIGADGVGSAVARSAGSRSGGGIRMGRKFGFSFDFQPAPPASPDALAGQCVEMFIGPNGYLGAVREIDGSVHIAGLVGQGNGPRDPLEFTRDVACRYELLRHFGVHEINTKQISRFCAIGPMPWRPAPAVIANQNRALVGDAAGYVEPFTGEGISWALQSAEWLGESASLARPGNWTQRNADHYIGMWREQVGSRQRACRAVAYGLEHSALQNAAFRVAGAWPNLTRRLIQQTVAM